VGLKESGGRVLRGLRNRSTGSSYSIPILCYHSWTMNGPGYGDNDHVALESDLVALGRKGYQILSITQLVACLRGEIPKDSFHGKKLVCLTCDDGMDHDFLDYVNDELGIVPSFHSILQRSRDWLPQYLNGPRAVSFVIASPESRVVLDRTCAKGRSEWNDNWWSTASSEGTLGIANHSWDHVHDNLEIVRQRDNKKGSFFEIATFDDAEGQIAEAQHYIDSMTELKNLPFFGYPYGHVSDYLRDEYLPTHGARIGLQAAFSTAGTSANERSNVWDIPRFICGFHWKTEEEFVALLAAVEAGER
jgi:peptidoglycan/xylan/chitin deacetylase (PgdA/CDA1 family)